MYLPGRRNLVSAGAATKASLCVEPGISHPSKPEYILNLASPYILRLSRILEDIMGLNSETQREKRDYEKLTRAEFKTFSSGYAKLNQKWESASLLSGIRYETIRLPSFDSP